jgi:phytoene/squalene synthetase
MIGKDELTDRVVAATDEALTTHELIKVKLQDGCLSERRDIAAELAQARSLLRKYMWNVGEMEGVYFLERCCVPRQLERYPFPDEAYLSADDIEALRCVAAELESGVRAE